MLDESVFKNAYVGVSANRRDSGIRLNPYVEIRDVEDKLFDLQNKLLALSIGCTVKKNFLRIQGIQNCKIVAPFVKQKWFKECMVKFDEGKHLTHEGIIEILDSCPRGDKTRKKKSQVLVQELGLNKE